MNSSELCARASFVAEFADYAAFQGRTVGMTGHRGLLGGLLQERLLLNGVRVETYPGDIRDTAELASWFTTRRLDLFFHFAAVVPVASVEADLIGAYETNVIGSYNVCKNVILNQPGCWLFHASSSHVYRPDVRALPLSEDSPLEPRTFYGITKLSAERLIEPLLQKLEAHYCIARIFSFSHARQQAPYLVPSLQERIAALKDGDKLEVDNPSAIRDIQDADAVIDCVLHLAHRRARGIINVGTGVGTSVREIAAEVARRLQKHIRFEGIDRDAPGSLIADTRRLRRVLSE